MSLSIPAYATRKFSISQHYGSDFTNGLTLDDVLTPGTAYNLYLYFEPNTIGLTETMVEGATVKSNTAVIPFTTADLPPAGDAIWGTAFSKREFVASLSEWFFGTEQKGVFVAYVRVQNQNQITLTTRNGDASKTENHTIGSVVQGNIGGSSNYLFRREGLGSAYPSADNYYAVLGAGDTKKIMGKYFRLETYVLLAPTSTLFILPLTRY